MIEQFEKFMLDSEAREMYITGIAGTGKTTSLRILIERCQELELNTVTCAYTHKAVGVLRSKLPKETNSNIVCTLHKYLKKRPTINMGATKLKEVDGNAQVSIPDRVHVLFIDEFSMIGEKDYVDILDLQYDEDAKLITKVIYIGDPNQLPPVKDMPSVIPKEPHWVKLTKIYRQAGDNPLQDTLVQLNEYINGSEAKPLTEHSNFIRNVDIVDKYKNCTTSKILLAYTNECVEELNGQIQGRYKPEIEDKLFCSTNRKFYQLEAIEKDVGFIQNIKGDIVELNSKFRTLETLHTMTDVQFFVLNDANEYQTQIPVVFGHNTYLQYQQELAKRAVHINKKIEAEFSVPAKDWAMQNWSHDLAKKRKHAWKEYLTFKDCVHCIDFTHAMTIHKSQGSTYENVFLDIDDIGKCANSDYGLYLKLLYVAISRASDTVYTN